MGSVVKCSLTLWFPWTYVCDYYVLPEFKVMMTLYVQRVQLVVLYHIMVIHFCSSP
jgi:hypothetical protein